MALQKSKTLENGTSGEYWKIISVTIYDKKIDSIKIGLWKNKTASDDSKPAIKEYYLNLEIPITIENILISNKNIYELLYNSIKIDMATFQYGNDYFTDAVDVLEV
jgi:hypothetical protein